MVLIVVSDEDHTVDIEKGLQMGTSCNIFVELEGNKHIGVYCHFDGYLDHMLPELHAIKYDTLYGLVLEAGTHGGIRILNERNTKPDPTMRTEFLDDNCTEYVFDPDDLSYAKFAYIKKLNGEVLYRNHREDGWHNASWSIQCK